MLTKLKKALSLELQSCNFLIQLLRCLIQLILSSPISNTATTSFLEPSHPAFNVKVCKLFTVPFHCTSAKMDIVYFY